MLSRSLFHCTQYRSANLNRDSLKERNQYVKNKILNDGGFKTKNKIKGPDLVAQRDNLNCLYNKKSNNVSIKINENSVTSRDEK